MLNIRTRRKPRWLSAGPGSRELGSKQVPDAGLEGSFEVNERRDWVRRLGAVCPFSGDGWSRSGDRKFVIALDDGEWLRYD